MHSSQATIESTVALLHRHPSSVPHACNVCERQRAENFTPYVSGKSGRRTVMLPSAKVHAFSFVCAFEHYARPG